MKKILKLVFLIIVILSIFLIYKFTNNKYLNYTSIGDGLSKGIDSYANIDYGYSDYIYFSRRFKQIMGVSPRKYLEEMRI